MIDINCDLGEGLKSDKSIMPYISSCSIACGGHFGNAQTIRQTLVLAQKFKLKVGAHPSFPDQESFGRKMMDLKKSYLKKSLRTQLDLFIKCCDELKIKCHHVKAHGALYNLIAKDRSMAELFMEVLNEMKLDVRIYATWESELALLAVKKGLSVYYEAFADRNYNEDLSLVSRSLPNAFVELENIQEHVHRMIEEGMVRTVSGIEVPIVADTICIHGDGEHALNIAKKVKESFY